MPEGHVQFTLRLPNNLHACLRQLAKEDGRSLQMWLQRHLEAVVGQDALSTEVLRDLKKRTRK